MAAALSEAEFGVPRSPSDLRAWCVGTIEAIASTKDGVNSIRMGRGLCKPLVQEVYPLAVWASGTSTLSDQALITPRLGSQSFDAIVSDPKDEPTTYFVEVTQAHMGQVEHFRMLHLEEKGWAPGPLSEVVREGKRGGPINAGRVTDTLRGHVAKTRDLIRNAIKAKLKKDYEKPIALVVAFEDFIVQNDPSVGDVLHEDVKGLFHSSQSPFFRCFLVGMSNKLLIRIDNES